MILVAIRKRFCDTNRHSMSQWRTRLLLAAILTAVIGCVCFPATGL